VLVGDPGRAYLPPDLERVASYRVRTTREIEDREVKPSAVFTL
jgi:predicted nicotinamide N-methyase